ncbi:hypothetical protein V3C99_012992 [Haemonchus contortus]
MIIDSYYFVTILLLSSSILINSLLLLVYFLRPLKMNTSKYFIPITAIQNIAYSLFILLGSPRIVAWNYCFVLTATGPMNTGTSGVTLLALVVVSFIFHILILANIFFYRYLQLSRSKYFVFYSTKKGFLSLLAMNLLITFNWACYIYFCLFPYDEVEAYVREPVRNIIGMDLSETAFLGFCVKPTLRWNQLIFIVDSMVTVLLLTNAGIYWSIKINITLRKSSLSVQTKAMHRQMNSLLVMQTVCPILFLHLPSTLQHCMTFFGMTSSLAFIYGTHILWNFFPLFSPLITMIFLKEYRYWFLKKVGVKSNSRVLIMEVATTTRIIPTTAQISSRSRSL